MSKDFENIPALSAQEQDEAANVEADHRLKFRLIRSGNPKYLNRYVNDPDASVRRKVAKYGGIKYCMELVHDPDDSVRIEVAKRANRNIANLMLNDPNETVRKYAKLTLANQL
ncbi:MAG: hypothetical protein KGH75_01500 [Rhodospirillales bacterium]|nr:hypothetical protein [Rhodospirillales bacterium]